MPDQPTIYFIRHGETDWNRERRYQGQKDIPLNETGRGQARRNGEALRAFLPGVAAARFLASPLGRTRESMEIVRGALGLPPDGYTVEPRLIELSYGVWEGSLQDDLMQSADYAVRAEDAFRWRPDRGESYADLYRRVCGWAETVRGDCVVVAHGGVSRCLRAHMLDLAPETIPELESPQDRVLILSRGAMRWL